ncbi:uncharacterized protein LOC135922996 isoform X2 [Gordionus sp. m RMFG-2023]|uniref:uncharacterized protein LOC135922996 isoform X2 n=1 Tax=Gordionus sp. m RMFG-2023 TaxID=3053472 RepID=UPI0031FC9B72
MELIVGEQYRLGRKIGSGSFGDIYLGTEVYTNQEVAIKLEHTASKHPQLHIESKFYRYMRGATGIPSLFWCGQEGEYNVMVLELLGPSLEDLFNYCSRKFSLKTVLLLADQLIDRVQTMHDRHFIHRDLKPDNFLMGFGKKGNIVHLIDFGLAKKYFDRTRHIPYRDDKNLTGTARYASVNTHLGIEQSRRDDMESLGYVLLYFIKGFLPWQGLKAVNKRQKYEMIMEKKISTNIVELCNELPKEFFNYVNYCRHLHFEEMPDYLYLKKMFRTLGHSKKYKYDYLFDWNVKKMKKVADKKVFYRCVSPTKYLPTLDSIELHMNNNANEGKDVDESGDKERIKVQGGVEDTNNFGPRRTHKVHKHKHNRHHYDYDHEKIINYSSNPIVDVENQPCPDDHQCQKSTGNIKKQHRHHIITDLLTKPEEIESFKPSVIHIPENPNMLIDSSNVTTNNGSKVTFLPSIRLSNAENKNDIGSPDILKTHKKIAPEHPDTSHYSTKTNDKENSSNFNMEHADLNHMRKHDGEYLSKLAYHNHHHNNAHQKIFHKKHITNNDNHFTLKPDQTELFSTTALLNGGLERHSHDPNYRKPHRHHHIMTVTTPIHFNKSSNIITSSPSITLTNTVTTDTIINNIKNTPSSSTTNFAGTPSRSAHRSIIISSTNSVSSHLSDSSKNDANAALSKEEGENIGEDNEGALNEERIQEISEDKIEDDANLSDWLSRAKLK